MSYLSYLAYRRMQHRVNNLYVDYAWRSLDDMNITNEIFGQYLQHEVETVSTNTFTSIIFTNVPKYRQC